MIEVFWLAGIGLGLAVAAFIRLIWLEFCDREDLEAHGGCLWFLQSLAPLPLITSFVLVVTRIHRHPVTCLVFWAGALLLGAGAARFFFLLS